MLFQNGKQVFLSTEEAAKFTKILCLEFELNIFFLNKQNLEIPCWDIGYCYALNDFI